MLSAAEHGVLHGRDCHSVFSTVKSRERLCCPLVGHSAFVSISLQNDRATCGCRDLKKLTASLSGVISGCLRCVEVNELSKTELLLGSVC